MKIKIAQRFRPFSHRAGAICPIPYTHLKVEAFPTLLRIGKEEIFFPIEGPLDMFSVQLDIERGQVRVLGKGRQGYFRFRIEAFPDEISLVCERGGFPSKRIPFKGPFFRPKSIERLALGSHKAQDWDLVLRRKDLKEILPPLFLLAQKIPSVSSDFLGSYEDLIIPMEKTKERDLLSFFLAGFHGILAPRLFDDEYQGIVEKKAQGNPFMLFSRGKEWIRSLFFQKRGNKLFFLPFLPRSFDAGRMLSLHAEGIGEIDLEWSKGVIKKALIHAHFDTEIEVFLPKPLKTFRLQRKKRLQKEEKFSLQKGESYALDRFEK